MNDIIQKLHNAFVKDYQNFLGTPSGSEPLSQSLYVDLHGGVSHSVDESESFNLKERLTSDMYPESSTEHECHLSLILGGSGQGKTSFALALAKHYWDKMLRSADSIHDKTAVLPIFISLPSVRSNFAEILQEFLKKRNIGPDSYSFISGRTNVLLVLDAYNEIVSESDAPASRNIWNCNNWGEHASTKAVVFTRPEVFSTISNRLQMFTYKKSGREFRASEYFIQKYSKSQMNEHIEKFVEFLRMLPDKDLSENSDNLFCMTKSHTKGTLWEDINQSKYYEWFGVKGNTSLPLPQLKDLAANPLILTLILLTLPGVATKVKNNVDEMSRICSTEVGLYDELFEQWFKFQQNKIAMSKLPLDLFNVLEHLPAYYEVYAQNLAVYILNILNMSKSEVGILTENYVLLESSTLESTLVYPVHNKELRKLQKEDEKHKILFTGANCRENLRHLRNGCPLYFYPDDSSIPRPELRCKFIHISLLEYLVCRDTFKGLRAKLNYFIQKIISDEESFRLNEKIIPNDVLGITYRPIHNSRNVNPAILQMLADRARIDDEFSNLLLEIVRTSTRTTTIRQMSANAMTILVLAGKSLSGQDFRDIQIPRADLRNALLAGTDLRGANLSNVKLNSSWLSNVKLQGACIEDVNIQQFTIRHDRVECQRQYRPVCHKDYLYCSYLGRIVKCSLLTGDTTEQFVLPDDPNSEHITLSPLDVSVTDKNELLVWCINSWTIFRWSLVDGKQLTSICDRKPDNGCIFNGTYSEPIDYKENSIDLLTYGPDEGNTFDLKLFEHKTKKLCPLTHETMTQPIDRSKFGLRSDHGCDIIRLYTLEHLATRIVTVQKLLRNPIPGNEKKFCFPINESKKIEIKFPIVCDFKSCDLTDKSAGFFALHTKKELVVHSLFTGRIVYKEASQVGELQKVVVKFNPMGKFLVIFCCDKNIFQILHTTSWTKTDLMKVIAKSITGGIDSFVFSSDSRKLATEHTFGSKSQIALWEVSSDYSTLNLLSRLVNYHRYTLIGVFCPQFTFCRNDKAIAYYTTAQDPEITIEDIHNVNYTSESMKHSIFKQPFDKVVKFCVSLNQKNGALLLQKVGDSWYQHTKRRDVQIFSFPYSTVTPIWHVRHENLFKSKDNLNFIDSISFDGEGELLLACGSDLRIYCFNLTGGIEYTIDLCPGVETMVGYVRFSSWFSTTQSKLVVWHENIYENGLLKLYDIRNMVDNLITSDDISFTYKSKKFNQLSGLTMDESSQWLAGWGFKSVYVWATSQLKTIFHFFQPEEVLETTGYFICDAIFAKKHSTHDSCYLIICSSQIMFILSVSCKGVSIKRKINTKQFMLFDKLEFSTDYPFCFATMGLFGDFRLHDMKKEGRGKDIDFNLWYRVDASKIVVNESSKQSCLIFNAGLDSGELNVTCIELNYFEKSWKMLWSYKPSYKFKAGNCNIGHCYIGNSVNIFTSLKKIGTVGSPMPSIREYIPYAYLFTKIIPGEKCSDVMKPIVTTVRNFEITENQWVISAVMKKSDIKCSTKCAKAHVWLIIEGIRDCRRFVIEAHKRHEEISNEVIISCKPIVESGKLKELASDHRANQWQITKTQGETVVRSIRSDQQRDDLQYNLRKKNCVEWCRSKLQLCDKSIGRRKFVELVVTPNALIK